MASQRLDVGLRIAPAAASTALVAALACIALPAAAADTATPAGGDAAMGAKLFLQCRACHTVGKGEASGVGPNLSGVYGAKAAAKTDYKYSTALSGAGIVWTAETLDHWLQQPTAVVKDTKMAFAGIKAAKARQDVIAYLATLDPAAPK